MGRDRLDLSISRGPIDYYDMKLPTKITQFKLNGQLPHLSGVHVQQYKTYLQWETKTIRAFKVQTGSI